MSCSFAYVHTSRAVHAGERRHARIILPLGSLNGSIFLEVRARRRLVAAQRREPGVVALERREERLHLVARAAGLGALGLPQPDAAALSRAG